jgi:serine/threonine protein phosphatase 1
MQRIFFIGDIHGCSKTFKKLVTEKIRIQKTDKLYCVGDYIDRGNDSKGVIDFILQLKNDHYQIYTIRGNHESMLLRSEADHASFAHWIRNGGDKTLESFKIKSITELKPVYLDFFKRTKYFFYSRNFIVVHAGLNFEIDNPLIDKYSMMWNRSTLIDTRYLNGKLLIHGHTAKTNEYITSQSFESPFNIDGGCVYKQNQGFGNLFALSLNDKKLLFQKNID